MHPPPFLHGQEVDVTKHVRRSAEQWGRIVHAFERSGQSGAAFCKEQCLAYSTFCAWRRKLGDEAASQTANFLPVKAIEQRNTSNDAVCTAELPGGIVLTWNEPPDPRWIAKLAHAFQ